MRKLKLTWYFHVLVFSSTLSHFLKSQWPDQLIILSSGIHRGSSRESASVISKNLKDMFLGRGQLKFPVSLAFARNCTKIRREVSSALLCWLDVLVGVRSILEIFDKHKQDINALHSVFIMKMFSTRMWRGCYKDPCPRNSRIINILPLLLFLSSAPWLHPSAFFFF